MSTPAEGDAASQLDLFGEGEHRYSVEVSEWRARRPVKPDPLTPAAYSGWLASMRDHAQRRPWLAENQGPGPDPLA